MRWIKGLVAVVFVVAACAYVWVKFGQPMKQTGAEEVYTKLKSLEENGSPSIQLKDINGDEFNLNHVLAPVVLVNFWASWCEPCIEEYPIMKELVKHMEGKIKLVAISVDENKQDMDDFINSFGSGDKNVIMVHDPEYKIAKVFGTDRLPETYIFGSDKKLIRKIPNSEAWKQPGLFTFFNELVKREMIELNK